MEEEESYKKPSYDGRQHYYKLWEQLMTSKAIAVVNNNYVLEERSLRALLDISRPFMREKDAEEVDSNLNKATSLLARRKDSRVDFAIQKYLNEASKHLMEGTKRLMLPISEEGPTDFDEEEFLRGS